MDLKSEPAFTETHVTDWEFATTGGTRVFTLEDARDSCELTSEGGQPCYLILETGLNMRTVIFVGPSLIGYTQHTRIKKTPLKPTGPRQDAPNAHQ